MKNVYIVLDGMKIMMINGDHDGHDGHDNRNDDGDDGGGSTISKLQSEDFELLPGYNQTTTTLQSTVTNGRFSDHILFEIPDSIKDNTWTHLTSELVFRNLIRHAECINSGVNCTFQFEVQTLQRREIPMTRRKHLTLELIL